MKPADEHQVATTPEQLAGDHAHLGQLHSGLHATFRVIERARDAYAESVELLAQLRNLNP